MFSSTPQRIGKFIVPAVLLLSGLSVVAPTAHASGCGWIGVGRAGNVYVTLPGTSTNLYVGQVAQEFDTCTSGADAKHVRGHFQWSYWFRHSAHAGIAGAYGTVDDGAYEIPDGIAVEDYSGPADGTQGSSVGPDIWAASPDGNSYADKGNSYWQTVVNLTIDFSNGVSQCGAAEGDMWDYSTGQNDGGVLDTTISTAGATVPCQGTPQT